jgi:hypothetical protein
MGNYDEVEAMHRKDKFNLSKRIAELEGWQRGLNIALEETQHRAEKAEEERDEAQSRLAAENFDYRERAEAADAENAELREALKYMADEDHWDECEEEDGYRLVRPGGARQVGIMLVSRDICPWIYAQTALAQRGTEPEPCSTTEVEGHRCDTTETETEG